MHGYSHLEQELGQVPGDSLHDLLGKSGRLRNPASDRAREITELTAIFHH
jgi:hypothetical protein